MPMNTTVTFTGRQSAGIAATINSNLRAAGLIAVLVASAVAAVNFAFIHPSGLGLYSSIGVGALTIDPLRRWLSRGDSSRRG